jgi:segregation and condensation protein B
LREDEEPLEPGDLDLALAPAVESEAGSEAAAETSEAVAETEGSEAVAGTAQETDAGETEPQTSRSGDTEDAEGGGE